MKVDHKATHIQTVWKISINLDKVGVSSPKNDCKALVIPERHNLSGEKSVCREHKDKTKYLPDSCFEGCLLDTSCSILRFERPRIQRALIEPDEMKLELSPDNIPTLTLMQKDNPEGQRQMSSECRSTQSHYPPTASYSGSIEPKKPPCSGGSYD
jgi:hypothetical protein